MKNILILLLCLISYNALSATAHFEVLNAEFGYADRNQNKTLCLTVLRSMQNDKIYGIIEDITDCFIARKAKSRIHQLIKLDLAPMQELKDKDLSGYLQIWGPQLKFYFSEGE